MRLKIPVVAAMIQKNDRILIAKKTSPSISWEFPGGKIEIGESKEEALKREIMEELAVQIEVGEHIGQSNVFVGEKEIVMDLFACVFSEHFSEKDLQKIEHEQLEWIKPSDLRRWAWAPADIPLLPIVEAYFGVKQ